MALMIQIKQRNQFNRNELRELHMLRAKVFKDRLGWEVSILASMEIDGYDALDPHYMVIRDVNNKMCGTLRMMPTNGPYMLKDTFPELLYDATAPEQKHVWELSRFAIESQRDSKFGFTERVMAALRRIAEFADKQDISKYVMVTTVAIERLLHHTGIETTRMGPPLQIGVERSVALEIHLREKNRCC